MDAVNQFVRAMLELRLLVLLRVLVLLLGSRALPTSLDRCFHGDLIKYRFLTTSCVDGLLRVRLAMVIVIFHLLGCLRLLAMFL